MPVRFSSSFASILTSVRRNPARTGQLWQWLQRGMLLAGFVAVLLPAGDQPLRASLDTRDLQPWFREDPAEASLQRARRAMVAADLPAFDAAIADIPADHALAIYLQYWRLRIRLDSRSNDPEPVATDAAVAAFIAREPQSLVADLLRRDWMLALARREDWTQFDRIYPQWVLKDESSPQCLAQVSAIAQGRPQVAAAHALLEAQPARLASGCDRLFTELADRGLLDTAQRMARLRSALQANQRGDILEAAQRLVREAEEPHLRTAVDRPSEALGLVAPPKRKGRKAPARQVTATTPLLKLIAVSRLSQGEPAAAARWLQTSAAESLGKADRAFLAAEIAASFASDLDPEALGWAKQAVDAPINDITRAWLLRAALQGRDWPLVERILLAMDPESRAKQGWNYWLGRAASEQKRPDDARRWYLTLKDEQGFYAKLAAEALGQRVTVPAAPPTPAAAQVKPWAQDPALVRAQAFYSIGMRFEGNREWNFRMRSLNPEQLRAVAHFALQQGMIDRAINTDERIGQTADYRLRFPTPHAVELTKEARAQRLDPAWVYGLIRQESRFILDARSHVGASGLMQIMPATGRWIARQMGEDGFRTEQLNELETNLRFGTYYLRSVLDDVDESLVLAAAGYNAGPRRAHRWRNALTRPLDGAIMAELIPFAETRGYVKNVISNAVDYAALMTGKPQSIQSWLGTIAPPATPTTASLP